MDWSTVAVSVSSSGVVGGVVAWVVGRNESKDRREALALEREKWEHQRSLPDRAKEDAAYEALHAVSSEITRYANQLEVYGMGDPSEHDERMLAIFDKADAAARDVNLYGNTYVHWYGVRMCLTFKAWVWSWQKDEDPEDTQHLRQLLLDDQQTIDHLIKSVLERRSKPAEAPTKKR